MNIEKRVALPLLVSLLSLSLLSACGKDDEESREAPTATKSVVEEVVTQLPAEAPKAMPVEESDSDLLPHEQMAKKFLKQLVEIDTTHSTGSATKAAEAMAEHLIAAGFAKEDVQLIEPVETKGNLIDCSLSR